MQLKVVRDPAYNTKMHYKQIHGKFPYKTYLELKGNSKYGRFIAVVSDSKIEDITEIAIKIEDNNRTAIDSMTNAIRKDYLIYKVKEINVLELETTPIFIFKPIVKKNSL